MYKPMSDELADQAALTDSLQQLDRGMEDVRADQGRELKSAVREIAEHLGLKLDR